MTTGKNLLAAATLIIVSLFSLNATANVSDNWIKTTIVFQDDEELYIRVRSTAETERKCDHFTMHIDVVRNIDEDEVLMPLGLLQKIVSQVANSEVSKEKCLFSHGAYVGVYVKDFVLDMEELRLTRLTTGDNEKALNGDWFLRFNIRTDKESSWGGSLYMFLERHPFYDGEKDERANSFGRKDWYPGDVFHKEGEVMTLRMRQTVGDMPEELARRKQIVAAAQNTPYAKKARAEHLEQEALYAGIASQAQSTSNGGQLLALVSSSCAVWLRNADLPRGTTVGSACGCFIAGIAASVPNTAELRMLASHFDIDQLRRFINGRPQGASSSLNACFR